MRLTTTTNVSVDGVMQGWADLRGSQRRFRPRWAIPLLDTEADLNQVYGGAAVGRRTYEIFAGYSGAMRSEHELIAAALNSRPKYVASTSLADPQWAGKCPTGDVATAIGDLVTMANCWCRAVVPSSAGCSPTTWSTSSTWSPIPSSSARAHGCSLDSGPDVALDLVNSRNPGSRLHRPHGRPDVDPEHVF